MDFDALKDLIQIISRHKAKQIELLGGAGKPSNMMDELYDGISKGKFVDDAQAAAHFYGVPDPKDASYRKLKLRLVRQLVNTSFFIDTNQPMYTDRARAVSNCYKDFAAAYLLLVRNDAKKAGIYLLEQSLEQAIKYEFVELAADISRILRVHYARAIGDPVTHEQYVTLHRKYEEMRRLEILAFDYYEHLVTYYVVRRSPNEEVHRMATLYYEELLPMADKVNTSSFYYFTFQIGVIQCFSVNDCEGVLSICTRALDILEHRKNTNKGALFSIALQKILALTQMRQFDDACEKTVAFCLERVTEGDYNWFKLMEAHFHYCLHARRYEDALSIYTTAVQQPRYELLGGNTRDDWHLYGGYLHLLAMFGKCAAQKVEAAAGQFRYAKFINTFSILDKDKEGMNIPLLLLPVVYNIAKGTFLDSGISIEGLDKYRQRYMENDMNRRSAIFVKMLIALIKRNYEQSNADRKIQKELAELKTKPLELSRQTFAVEVVPYEDLWEMLIAESE